MKGKGGREAKNSPLMMRESLRERIGSKKKGTSHGGTPDGLRTHEGSLSALSRNISWLQMGVALNTKKKKKEKKNSKLFQNPVLA